LAFAFSTQPFVAIVPHNWSRLLFYYQLTMHAFVVVEVGVASLNLKTNVRGYCNCVATVFT